VTHDQVEAMTLRQRILVMQGGRVEQIGTPAPIYGTPASSFVAGFIGFPAMNVLAGNLDSSRGVLSVAEQYLAVRGDLPEGANEVRVGTRPENLHADNGANDRPCRLEALVELAKPLGGDTIVHCALPATGESGIRVRTLTGQRPGEGERITLGFRPLRLRLIDADSGRLDGVSVVQ